MNTKTNILVINAISTNRYNQSRLSYLKQFISPDTKLSITNLTHGYESLEYLSQELYNSLELIKVVRDAEAAGYHGILLNCFYDPALDVARESVSIPVVGAGEANLFIASRLGHKFGVLSTSKKESAVIEKNIENYHLEHSCAGVFSLDISVPKLQAEGFTPPMIEKICLQVQKAVGNGAENLLIACTAATGISEVVSSMTNVPLLDPGILAIKAVEMAASLYRYAGISHSKSGIYSYENNAVFHD